MLTDIRLSGFRVFPSLRIEGLTRVNLFVGANGAGKSCILEGAELLLSGGSPRRLWMSALRRDETNRDSGSPGDVEIRHLFHGHEIKEGSRFEIEGTGVIPSRVSCRLVQGPASPEFEQLMPAVGVSTLEGREPQPDFPLALEVNGAQPVVVPLSPEGELSRRARYQLRLANRPEGEAGIEHPTNFVATGDFERLVLGRLWDNVVLTPRHQEVIEALRIIEARIEDVAFLASGRNAVVKLAGSDERLPLGSMGDGVKRLLVLAVNLVNSERGYLLVDEIDTGLHYSVMERMWRLVVETARKLELQVFATTHSLDCVHALAKLFADDPALAEDVSLHRVERGQDHSLKYSANEIQVAAKQRMEIR